MSDEKKNDIENDRQFWVGVNQFGKLTKRREQSDPFVASDGCEHFDERDDAEPETAPEPAPEPVVIPEPIVVPEPEKPLEDDDAIDGATLNLMAKHYRKVHGVAFVTAKAKLLADPDLLEEYKNLKKW